MDVCSISDHHATMPPSTMSSSSPAVLESGGSSGHGASLLKALVSASGTGAAALLGGQAGAVWRTR